MGTLQWRPGLPVYAYTGSFGDCRDGAVSRKLGGIPSHPPYSPDRPPTEQMGGGNGIKCPTRRISRVGSVRQLENTTERKTLLLALGGGENDVGK